MEHTQAWLAYRPASNAPAQSFAVQTGQSGPIIDSIYQELDRALEAMFGARPCRGMAAGACQITLALDPALDAEEYHITRCGLAVDITAGGHRGLLYGTFALLRHLQLGEVNDGFDQARTPSNPLRMVNHWDNLDGSIERGYSGRSFFFAGEEILINERTRDYARLMASVGINAASINNVNVGGPALELLTGRYRSRLVELAGIFAGYGIRLFLSISFGSPVQIGGLDTADPLDERVRQWWKDTSRSLFEGIPNFGGFLVKADSEGSLGPFAYGRTHADGANMLAEAVRPFGGIVIWRCFVYNCRQDWRDNKTDRACQAYANFIGLDGQFADNVILQVKNGPVDFQVREPVHPLFGGMQHTNLMLEVQIAQEYTGQQRHVCYLLPWFREILDFRTHNGQPYDTVKDIVSGKNSGSRCCGMTAVINTGNDPNWTGHDLAAANLYGYGRLAFETALSPETIAAEWIRLTLGEDPLVRENVMTILMMSWPTYEKYTAPLAIGWMVAPYNHFDPSVDGYEYDRWGTYHRISHSAIGRDRSSRGTGYSQQYFEPLASMYDSIDTCPEEMLLFFHRVRFDHVLSTGETLLQHIYNTHFEGVEDVERMLALWQALEGRVDEAVYERVLGRMRFQLTHAKEWRDCINTYMHRVTEVPDEQGRKIYD